MRVCPLTVLLLASVQAMVPPPSQASADPAPGIAETLAAARAGIIEALRYELAFRIPARPEDPIEGHVTIRFTLKDASQPLVLDFAGSAERMRSLNINGAPAPYRAVNGHLVVPAAALRTGEQTIAIEFLARDAPLHRNPDFLYTLFVPARAHLAFPCFDQPSLKARYTLTLEVPAAWEVVANGAEIGREQEGDRIRVRFAETPPLPTFVFAFAAGRFQVETAERDGRRLRMFHRETDAAKVARNREAIFDLHAAALAWLEQYTGIPYRFGKFDIVLIPSFQFSGMEHAGAIFYNASGLLLEASATQNQRLARASTIAHETSHGWFGNLVTMRWFDDVWLKEVFASLLAAKIVNPSFPEIDHDLRFLLTHYPTAYEVDRTAGTNPIRQRLANLDEAGTLYGAIIYHKAPIAMRNLEAVIGVAAFRAGLQAYLGRYAFGNASWPDLVRLLDARTDDDLAAWGRAWVEEPGRPTIVTHIQMTDGRITRLAFTQHDPRGRGLVWDQELAVTLGYPDGERMLPVRLTGPRTEVPEAVGLSAPLFVLPNGRGIGYGDFQLDAASREWLLAHLHEIGDGLTRGSAWVTLWDEMLRGEAPPHAFVDLALRALPEERDELNTQRILGYLRQAYWRYLPDEVRAALAPIVERTLRAGIGRAQVTSRKSAYFEAFRDVALTPEGVGWVERIWRREETIAGLPFAETDEIDMAMELAVRGIPAWKEVLEDQLARTENPDRKARFAFVMPALDGNSIVRDAFFASLADVENRRHEPWVLEALAYLHHPLRAVHAERYIRPSLERLQEIQRTGDIFFPKGWMEATLGGHNSPAAADTVKDFIASLPPSYPPRLRQIIEASADGLFRSSRIVRRRSGSARLALSQRPYP